MARKASKRRGAAGGPKRRATKRAIVHRSPSPTPSRISPSQMRALRDLFWTNVLRDTLNGLTMLAQKQPELFDGRFSILTRRGERIPVAAIEPLFACSIPGSPEERDASIAVQCTIFRVHTPSGDVFTFPLHEIRGLHTFTPELIERLQHAADGTGVDDEEQRPFGLAAFAALPKPPLPRVQPENELGE